MKQTRFNSVWREKFEKCTRCTDTYSFFTRLETAHILTYLLEPSVKCSQTILISYLHNKMSMAEKEFSNCLEHYTDIAATRQIVTERDKLRPV